VTEEKIAHDAGASTEQSLSVHELVRLVREAGRRPVERDTVFSVVKEW
jgi:aminodeoxyfutalosine synthase